MIIQRFCLFVIVLLFFSCEYDEYISQSPIEENEGVLTVYVQKNQYTKDSTISISGLIRGYDSIHCIGGLQEITKKVGEGYFDLHVPLKLNQLNKLILYAQKNHFYSDTTIINVSHDTLMPSLVDYSTKNFSVHIKDSIDLVFNDTVRISSLKLVRNSSVYNIRDNATTKGNIVRFYYFGFIFGYTYPIRYTVSDRAGNEINGEIILKFYDDEVELLGTLIDCIINKDANDIYIISSSPNQVVVLDYNTFEIKSLIPIDYRPYQFTVNPFNKLLYITSRLDAKIMVVDLASRQQIRYFELPPLTGHPKYYASGIGFTNNGIGVVSSTQQYGSSFFYYLIDSRNNDTTWVHPNYSQSGTSDTYKIFPVNDGNDLVVLGNYHLYFNGTTQDLSEITLSYRVYGHDAVACNSQFNLFAGINGSLYLCNTEGDVIGNMNRNGNYESRLQFSQYEDEENFVYHYEGMSSDIRFYDLKNEVEIFNYDFFSDISIFKINPYSDYIYYSKYSTFYKLSLSSLRKYAEIIF